MMPSIQSAASAASVWAHSDGRNADRIAENVAHIACASRSRLLTTGIGLWLVVVASVLSATGIHAAEAEAQPNAWAQLLRPNEIAWPEQPAQVELFGRTWHRVQTKYFQVHFDPGRTAEAREFVKLIDNVYGLYMGLLGIKPTPAIQLYLCPSKEVHRAIVTAWTEKAVGRSRSSSHPDGTAVALNPYDQTVKGRIARAAYTLGSLFDRRRRGRLLPAQPTSAARAWWRLTILGHCSLRASDTLYARDSRARIRASLPPGGPPRLAPVIAQMNAGARADWARYTFLGCALCYYVESLYGLDKLGEIWRALADVPAEQPLPVVETFSKALGKPFREIENGCAALLGVAININATLPPTVVRRFAAPQIATSSMLRDAIKRRDYPLAIKSSTVALAAPGGAHTPSQWAYLHYATGFAFDQLGQRAEAIGHYERALIWVEPDSKLCTELEAALMQRPTSFYGSTGRRRVGGTPWAVAEQPVDLQQDERRFAFLRGGTHAQFPFLLPDGHFAQLDAQEKARLANQCLQASATAQDTALWQAIETLGLLRERRALPLLHQIVLRKGTTMGYRQCWVATRALYRIADPQSIPTLVQATRCLNTNVRAAASFALRRLTGQRFRRPEEWQRWWGEQQREER